MMWFRIDNRLVHGQVIEAWLPYLRAHTLVVVNDVLAADHLQQEIMKLAIPGHITVTFTPVSAVKKIYEHAQHTVNGAVLFLIADCLDVERMQAEGISIPVLNIGNMHYAPGKEHISPHVAVSLEEKTCLKGMEATGTVLDFRSVPSDSPTVGAWNA